MRWRFFGTIVLSVFLGMLLVAAFEKWLRGHSYVWWLFFLAVIVFAIFSVSKTLLRHLN